MTRPLAVVLAAILVAGAPHPASAYLKLGAQIGTQLVDVRWNRPVPYFVLDQGVPGVDATALRDAVMRAFATWQSVETASVGSQFQGLTTVPPGAQDGRTTLGFVDRPDLDRVLAATSFLLDSTTGAIVEAEVFFNARFAWSAAAAGEPGRTDLQSVALHEIGHLLGLGHSAIGETEMAGGARRVVASGAVMFPIAFTAGSTADRALQPDDIAGISDLYQASGFGATSSSISGRVTMNGAGVFGAHVTAFNLESGVLIGGFTLNDRGDYVVGGLPPGTYVVRAEPLDDADTDSFFPGPVNTDFRAGFASRVVVAPAGGTSTAADVEVRPK